jgi:hypothetical protein
VTMLQALGAIHIQKRIINFFGEVSRIRFQFMEIIRGVGAVSTRALERIALVPQRSFLSIVVVLEPVNKTVNNFIKNVDGPTQMSRFLRVDTSINRDVWFHRCSSVNMRARRE